MAKVVGIGASVFDILIKTDAFPGEDTKLQGKESKTQCGGPCAVALIAVSKLGESSSYIGTAGNDMYGKRIVEALGHYGVSTDCVKVIPDVQSFHSVVILNTANATRTCVWCKGTLPELSVSDVPEEEIRNASYLHLDGHQLEAACHAAEIARKNHVKVSLDAGAPYPGIERLLPLVDVLIPSEEFVIKFTGAADAIKGAEILCNRYNPEVLIVTQGSKGGFIFENGREVRYPSFKVDAIDSNGAGDTFHGAFLAGRLKGMDVYDAACFASATSALKCTRFGATEGIPEADEVFGFLNKR